MRMVVLAAGNGRRLCAETGGRPKQLLDLGGGRTLLDRLLELGRELDLSPLIVTRHAHAASFEAAVAAGAAAAAPTATATTAAAGTRAAAEVLVIEDTSEMLDSLYEVHGRLEEDFVFVGGDILLLDPGPIRELLRRHLAERPYGSYLYRRSPRHAMKMRPGSPVPRVSLRHEGDFPYSLPSFGVQGAAALADLAVAPRGEYLQRALDRGERLRFQEYTAPAFEIDTPEDLAAARRYFS
jgi:NDP-sugar pyrophosphorylase family protein